MEKTSKEKILEATLELANEKGLGKVSISQVAERAGLKKSSVYSHFNSKDEIIGAMYTYFRKHAVSSYSSQPIDYGSLVQGKSLREVLILVTTSYMEINSNPDMSSFYRLIMAEITLNPVAAEIMVAETNKMVLSTKQLFYALQAKKIVEFENPDGAAFSFAMGVHAVMDFIMDARFAGSASADRALEAYIDEFCRVYGKRQERIVEDSRELLPSLGQA